MGKNFVDVFQVNIVFKNLCHLYIMFFLSEPEYNFRVPRTNFFPQPNVDAAVVTFRLKQAPDYPSVASTKSFFSMVG
ncbi:hypothetical protein Gotur_011520 [Gossypium turneri]